MTDMHTLAAAPTVLAGEITGLLEDKTSWAEGFVPKLFVVCVVAVATFRFVQSSGVLKRALMSVVAGAVVYAVMTNLTSIGQKVGSELSLGTPAQVQVGTAAAAAPPAARPATAASDAALAGGAPAGA